MVASVAVVRIDVVSDVVCPWCFVGKRRLEQALTQWGLREPGVRPAVRWHAFQLNPDLPAEGVDRRAYLDAKFGGAQRADTIYERVREAGDSAGIDFAFERIRRQPNTLAAHRLVAWAQERGDASPLVEKLFRAYFMEGRPVGDHPTLAAIAGEAGLDAEAAAEYLATGEGAQAVVQSDRRARELGIQGVPFFIVDGGVGVSGAQSAEVLLDAMQQAHFGSLPCTPST